jgi:flagellar hook-associated protein 2
MFSNNITDGTYVTSSTTAGIAGDSIVTLTSLLDSSNGDSSGVLFVNSKNADKQVQSYQDDLQKLSDRMDMLLARYNKQFSAMESIVGESKSLGTSLTSTFAGMSNMYKNN